MPSITVTQLNQIITQEPFTHLIDVRTPSEYHAQHATHSINLPLDLISPSTLTQAKLIPSKQPLYIICQTGARSSKAIQKLEAQGVQNLIQVEGGTSSWIAAGLPTIKKQGAISLERQVRILTGSLIFLGVVLGHFFHPAFYLLCGFIGCGLVWAGITDWCGLGLLLAKMPWNKEYSTCTKTD
jgi:rhodanese-related sulfurtransferase